MTMTMDGVTATVTIATTTGMTATMTMMTIANTAVTVTTAEASFPALTRRPLRGNTS